MNSPLHVHFNTKEWFNGHPAPLFLSGEWQRTGKITSAHENQAALASELIEVPFQPDGHDGKVSQVSSIALEKYLNYWVRISIFWNPRSWPENLVTYWFLLFTNLLTLGEDRELSSLISLCLSNRLSLSAASPVSVREKLCCGPRIHLW